MPVVPYHAYKDQYNKGTQPPVPPPTHTHLVFSLYLVTVVLQGSDSMLKSKTYLITLMLKKQTKALFFSSSFFNHFILFHEGYDGRISD